MPSPFVTYHPSARVALPTKPAPRVRAPRCTFHETGTFCVTGCTRCGERLDARALDVLTAQAAASIRTFGRNGQKGGAR